MKLSTRLHTIFDMVQPCGVAADIGCDHGLLPIALIQSGKCAHVYACDVRKGPLSRAQEAIRQYGLQNSITTKLCDGLQGLEDDVEVVVIAGMGYDTICRILMKGDKQLKHYKQIILQCNTHVEDMRRWLHQNGFTIDAEQLVRIITIIRCSPYIRSHLICGKTSIYSVCILIGIHYLKSIGRIFWKSRK